MARATVLFPLYLAFIASAGAQTPNSSVGKPMDAAVVYATYAAKPDYSYFARSRHMEGTGVFQLHIRADGTVSSVETIQSVGYRELDDSARAAFSKWRCRPGRPTKVKMPMTFSSRRHYRPNQIR